MIRFLYRNIRYTLAHYLLAPENSPQEVDILIMSSIREMRACALHIFWDIIREQQHEDFLSEIAIERMGQTFLTSLGGSEAETVPFQFAK